MANNNGDAMNPNQVMGIIACCTILFAVVVGFLTMNGMPLVTAFLSMYAVAILSMLGMQCRARQTYDGVSFGQPEQRRRPGRAEPAGRGPVAMTNPCSLYAIKVGLVVEAR